MKNNNKNRKLKFIREKNNLRFGITVFCGSCKIHNKLMNDKKALNIISNDCLLKTEKELFKKFKISKLRNTVLLFGYDGDDFIMDKQTLRIELNNKIL